MAEKTEKLTERNHKIKSQDKKLRCNQCRAFVLRGVQHRGEGEYTGSEGETTVASVIRSTAEVDARRSSNTRERGWKSGGEPKNE